MQLAKPDPLPPYRAACGRNWIRTALILLPPILLAPACGAAERYQFVLEKGKGVPVCEAYEKRLNRSEFSAPPYCDRPESSDLPSFSTLNRVFLNVEEIVRLDRQANGFIRSQDIGAWEKRAEQRKRLGQPTETDEVYRKEIELQVRRNKELQKHFRFEPLIDIDNDGVLDSVVVWRETGYECGGSRGTDPAPVAAPTYVLILDKQGNVDPVRTKEVFGHPMGGFEVQYKDKGAIVTKESKQFRPIGWSLGILVFDRKTYFDTFYYGQWGDLENRRKDDPRISHTLALLKREHGKTELVCELLWKESKKR